MNESEPNINPPQVPIEIGIPKKPYPKGIAITDHAYKRAKERLSLGRKPFIRMAEKAFKDGIRHSDCTGKLNKYVTKIWAQNKKASNIRIYGEVLFIFADNVLITVYQVPHEYRSLLKHYR